MRYLGAAATAALAILSAASAHADITITMHTSFDGPMFQKMQESGAGSALDQFSDSVIYSTPKHMRMDMGPIIMITDPDNNQITMLDSAKQTYTQSPYDPRLIKALRDTTTATRSFGGVSVTSKVIDTGKTTKVLGHVARHYVVLVTTKMAMANLPANMRSSMRVDILSATDFDQADVDSYNSGSGGAAPQIKGIPLATTMTYTTGFMKGTTIHSNATSVTNTPVPDSTFAIPDGYTKAANQGNGMGFGMGGGN